VERCVRDAEVAGSNPVDPTIRNSSALLAELEDFANALRRIHFPGDSNDPNRFVFENSLHEESFPAPVGRITKKIKTYSFAPIDV
ncbi:MAG: hypothetical protein VW576_08015, partial [Opitutae bacterium]